MLLTVPKGSHTLVRRSRQLLQPLRERTIFVFLGLAGAGLYILEIDYMLACRLYSQRSWKAVSDFQSPDDFLNHGLLFIRKKN